jgi:ABC-type branched-subunit amino acid transport system substrate-binding protein
MVTIAFAMSALIAAALGGCASAQDGAPAGDSPASDPGITDTKVTIGSSTPLSGPVALPGSQALAGLTAYFGAVNDDGGVKFGDGKTRTVEIKSYDDAWDPAKAVSNFRQMAAEGVFADVGSLGSGNNIATMPLANELKLPNIFVQATNDKVSANQKENPWVIGFVPTQRNEGESIGKFIASLGEAVTVAILQQNDETGLGYVEGFKKGIEGSKVKIAEVATFGPTDPTVDAQMGKLAATKADFFFNANTLPTLTPAALLQAQQLGWLPKVILVSVAQSKRDVLGPGNAKAFPSVYTAAFSKGLDDSQYANDKDMKTFKADMKKYASAQDNESMIPQAAWGYMVGAALEAAFEKMKTPTRAAMMEAIHSLAGIDLPLLLPGMKFDASSLTAAPLQSMVVAKYDFKADRYVVTK